MENTTSVFSATFGPVMTTESHQSTFNPSVKAKIVFCIELLLAVVTVGMNVFILLAFHIEKKLQTYSNQYILNITISDILVGFIMAIRSTLALYDNWIFGTSLFYVFVGVQNTLLGVSVLGVIAICMDRYVATWYPIQHFKRKNKRIAHFVNGITWLLSISFWIPIATIWDLVVGVESNSQSIVFSPNYGKNVYSIVGVTLCRMIIPFVLIVTLYGKIFLRVKTRGSKKLSKRFNRSLKVGVETGAMATKERKMNPSACWTERQDQLIEENNCASLKKACNTTQNHFAEVSVNLSEQTQIQTNSRKHHASIVDIASSSQEKTQQITDQRITTVFTAKSSIQQNHGKARQVPSSENSKVMLTLTFIIVVFFVTWLPNAVSLIYNNVFTSDFVLNEVTRWITFSNSLLNPVAYAMAQPLFRTTILRIVRCRK
eukprot:XP_001188660.1 PREDICTED: 5-hydroxytryptamine receptor 1A-alpha-like [Strongylocentrotus purpuratus]